KGIGTDPMTPYDDPPRPRPPAWAHPLSAFLLIFIAVAMVVGGYFVYQHWFAPGKTGVDPSAELRPVMPRGELPGAEQDRVRILAQVKPSVVFITTFDLRRDYFSSDISAVPAGAGSGFVWDKKGHIVTNFHVIQNADAAQVQINDGQHTWTY